MAASATWKRDSLERLQEDDVVALVARDDKGMLGMPVKLVCKYSAQSRSLRCLRWAFMRGEVARAELLPMTADWPEGRRWLLEH